jgi:hypothetical protein
LQDEGTSQGLAFSGTCDAGGTISAEVACQGTLSLIAIDPFENLATLQPNPGFRCDVTTDLEFEVVNNGSEICGPQFGTGSFSAFYDVSPENLSFDP